MKEDIAFEQGEYKNFNGVIMWGNTECFVKKSKFTLIIRNGVKIILWYFGEIIGGIFSDGVFNNGLFKNSKFMNSVFKNGKFINSEWISGEWHQGVFIKSRGNRYDINRDKYISPFSHIF